MAMQKKNDKKKKRRLKPVPVLVLAAVLIGIIVSLALVFGEKPKEESINVSISEAGGSSDKAVTNTSIPVKKTTVSIDMDSCAIPIGTTLKVTASMEPVENDKTINWVSSDENVFTVDSEGIITIKGIGTSALTATIGSSSDAIVIEGVQNNDLAKSQNDLPIFNLTTSKVTSSNGISSNGISSNGTSNNSDPNVSSIINNAGNIVNPVNSNNTDNASGTNNNAGNIGDTGNAGNPVDSNSGTNIGMKSTELYASLSDIGYSKMFSNVYVYQENNTYYGEIVIQSNVTIVYIKQRCEGFDIKIKEVIARLLPTQNAEVWSNYLSASSDRTFTAQGRMVRIITAANGGHSQIVIYN